MGLRSTFNTEVTFSSPVTDKGFTFSGTLILEGTEVVKHHGNHASDVVHLTEVESSGSDVNQLHHPLTLTGQDASAMVALLAGGTKQTTDDTDHHGHHG